MRKRIYLTSTPKNQDKHTDAIEILMCLGSIRENGPFARKSIRFKIGKASELFSKMDKTGTQSLLFKNVALSTAICASETRPTTMAVSN